MKIAIVAQHAISCTRAPARARARTTPDSASSPRISPGRGHRVTAYAQKRQPDMPDRAELGGLRVVHIPVGAVGKRGDAELLAHVPAFGDPLRARWRRERPDVVHAVNRTSGLPSSREQSSRRPGSSPTRAHSLRTSATPDPEARHVSAPAPVPSS